MKHTRAALMLIIILIGNNAAFSQENYLPQYDYPLGRIVYLITNAMKIETKEQSPINPEDYGIFEGDLILKAVGKERKFSVEKPFSFIDAKAKKWEVPVGAVVDGASIPRPFWTLIGAPWSGPYARASVIHDYNCDNKTEEWKPVHRVFYDAMLANDMDIMTAKIMYWAVYRFGPRWEFQDKITHRCADVVNSVCVKWVDELQRISIDISPPIFFDYAMTQVEIERTIISIRINNMSLSEIEEYADDNIKRYITK